MNPRTVLKGSEKYILTLTGLLVLLNIILYCHISFARMPSSYIAKILVLLLGYLLGCLKVDKKDGECHIGSHGAFPGFRISAYVISFSLQTWSSSDYLPNFSVFVFI